MNDTVAGVAAVSAGALLVPLLVALAVYVWVALALGAVFRKTGEEGWQAWVPVYNTAVLLRLGGFSGWWVLLGFVPVADVALYVIVVVACHRVNVGLGRGAGMTVLAALLFPIWASVMGWGTARWIGTERAAATSAPPRRRHGEPDADALSWYLGAPPAPVPPAPAASGSAGSGPAASDAAASGRAGFGRTGSSPAASGAGASGTARLDPAASGRAAVRPAPPLPTHPAPAREPVLITPDAPGPVVADDLPWAGRRGHRDGAPAAGGVVSSVPQAPGSADTPAGVEPGASSAPAGAPAASPAAGAAPAAWPAPAPASADWSAPSAVPGGSRPSGGDAFDAPLAAPPDHHSAVHGGQDIPAVGSPWAPPVIAPAPAGPLPASQPAPRPDAAAAPRSTPPSASPSSSDELDDDLFDETVIVRRGPAWTLTPAGGGEVSVESDVVIIGRHPASDPAYPTAQLVSVADHTRTMSKTHARLERRDDRWEITDLHSTNGIVLVDADGVEAEIAPGHAERLFERFLLGDVEVRLTRSVV